MNHLLHNRGQQHGLHEGFRAVANLRRRLLAATRRREHFRDQLLLLLLVIHAGAQRGCLSWQCRSMRVVQLNEPHRIGVSEPHRPHASFVAPATGASNCAPQQIAGEAFPASAPQAAIFDAKPFFSFCAEVSVTTKPIDNSINRDCSSFRRSLLLSSLPRLHFTKHYGDAHFPRLPDLPPPSFS